MRVWSIKNKQKILLFTKVSFCVTFLHVRTVNVKTASNRITAQKQHSKNFKLFTSAFFSSSLKEKSDLE